MSLPDKFLCFSSCTHRQKRERGNALFMILIAIVLLAALTYAISQDSQQQSSVLPKQTIDNQINQLITYASALGGSLQQMVTNGENPNTLYSSLNTESTGFTSPYNLEIFAPLGGGITYMSQSSPDAGAVATNYNINAPSIITGVGCSSGTGCPASTTGHIIFTASISSASYCAQINYVLTGSTTVPVMTDAVFTPLFNSPTVATTVGSSSCTPTCANIARYCVSNTEGTAWGFYADLFPPQNSNTQ